MRFFWGGEGAGIRGRGRPIGKKGEEREVN